jgi:glycerophosphoryl diester phosphodiesterase
MLRALAASVAALSLIAATTPPAAAADPNPWLDYRVTNMAHQGGEAEAPSGTLYAFKRATALGADMIELDVQSTKDGKLVSLHDATVDRTTNGTGRVRDLTLAQVQALDAGYDFGAPAYPFRGIRTGDKPAPPGYTADDFRIPSLSEVMRAFPDTPINIEIKGTSDTDTASFLRTARLLAGVINASGRTDIIVVSFEQLAVTYFHTLAPKIALAPGIAGILAFWSLGLPPGPGVKALQVPVEYSGIRIVTADFVRRAHDRGYAVHVWFSGGPENEALYNELLDLCVDGMMPAYPSRLEKVLDDRDIVRPGNPTGTDPCATP